MSSLGISPTRDQEIKAFLKACGWQDATRAHLAGDAGHRRYERLMRDGEIAVLMDDPLDPNDTKLKNAGRTYGQVAHLAPGCEAFVAIGSFLRSSGFRAPEIFKADIDRGLMLLEDLGDHVYGPEIADASDPAATEEKLYCAAVEVLAAFHDVAVPDTLPVEGREAYALSHYDRGAYHIEADLLLEWFGRFGMDREFSPEAKDRFHEVWDKLIDHVLAGPEALTLRDYHSPNLLWFEGPAGNDRVGILDFQDALIGHPAYDLASLLQDARRTVPPALEEDLKQHYAACANLNHADDFFAAYAILGAHRVTKVIGIFYRLWQRDGKKDYLQHLPRLWEYLERSLQHTVLSEYNAWLDENVPVEMRK